MGNRTLLVRFDLGLGYILGWGIPLGYTLSKRTFRDRGYFGYILGKGEFPPETFRLRYTFGQGEFRVNVQFGLGHTLGSTNR